MRVGERSAAAVAGRVARACARECARDRTYVVKRGGEQAAAAVVVCSLALDDWRTYTERRRARCAGL